jgi:uncharacterized protein YceH (UPF0502 family)
MDCELTENEVRVLGSLIEKELTTPEYYPLTLNAVVTASNQKSNRDPVMSLSAEDAEEAIEGLRKKTLAWRRNCAGARVPKFEHNFNVKYKLYPQEVAVMCVLLLRGPQTVGEIKGRTGRMFKFESLEEVNDVLTGLMEKETGPFVKELPRQPGRKERRYMHLLAGETDILEEGPPLTEEVSRSHAKGRIETLEDEITSLRKEIAELRGEFEEFKRAFE